MPNKPIQKRAIPEPYTDVNSLHAAVSALKEGYEAISGQRGTADDAAVTWGDLIRLGWIRPDQVPKDVGSPSTLAT